MSKENKEFGNNLKRIRKSRGLTQAQLGDLINITDRAVSSWESGRTEPSIAMIDVICDVLKCTKDELLGNSNFKLYYRKPRINENMLFKNMDSFWKSENISHEEIYDSMVTLFSAYLIASAKDKQLVKTALDIKDKKLDEQGQKLLSELNIVVGDREIDDEHIQELENILRNHSDL